jgi:hypothetical protein
MSDGKVRGKQSRDTSSEDTLLGRPGTTDPLLETREGATDAQIDALRQGLPHLADPSLQDSRVGKQSEETSQQMKTNRLLLRRRGLPP